MLLDVAAILSTSASPTGVAEAFSVLETRSGSIAASFDVNHERIAWEQALDGARTPASARLASSGVPTGSPWIGAPSPFVGPQPAAGVGVPADVLSQLRGVPLLEQLTLLSRSTLADFGRAHPEVLADVVARPPAPSATADFWSGLDAAERARFTSAVPELVGSLEGVAYADRDAANRRTLGATIHSIETRLAEQPGRAEADELTARLHMLEQIRTALEPGESGLTRSLITLDTTGAGRAAIAIGDLDEAEFVTYLVPGMFFGVESQLVSWTTMADELAAEQNTWLTRLGDDGSEAATVSWIGYDTPTLVNVASMELAREGRDLLTAAIEALHAQRADDEPFVSIFGHSYGSTAAMLAVEERDLGVDALAVMGSPGSPARTASELHVENGNVWVGVAWWDPIPSSGVFGSQPASAEYGARLFGVDGATDPVTGERLGGAFSHNDYFTAGGESFRNLALIGIDRNDLVLTPGEDGPVLGKALASR